MTAGFLNTLIRHSDAVNLADMTGLMEFAGIWKRREQVYAMPSYYAFRLYTAVKGDTILPVTTDSGTYGVRRGIGPSADTDGIPYIDVVATRSADGRTETLLCVNRSLEQNVPTSFDLGGMRPRGPVHMERIAAESRFEQNDDNEPHHIMPQASTTEAPAAGKPLSVLLPHDSVTVIRFAVK